MIRCNLAILLAEQNLKITKISNDTGISRTTLTSLASNNSQGVQFDTLNTLCSYLNVSPSQLISVAPFEVIIDSVDVSGIIVNALDEGISMSQPLYTTIDIDLVENSEKYRYTIICETVVKLSPTYSINPITLMHTTEKISIVIDLTEYQNIESADNIYLLKKLKQLPRPFLVDIENNMRSLLVDFFYGDVTWDNVIIRWIMS